MATSQWQILRGKQRPRTEADVTRVERAKDEYRRRLEQVQPAGGRDPNTSRAQDETSATR